MHGWTVFKGMQDGDESQKATAYREFLEETGINLSALGLTLTPLASYKQKTKNVVLFFCDDEDGVTVNIKPKCHSMVIPGNFPEIDGFAWMTKEEAYTKVFPSQKFLFK